MTAAMLRIDYGELLDFAAQVFRACGLPAGRAGTAAEALCYGDLTGPSSHGLANLDRVYLPMFDQKRVNPSAELEILADFGASVLVDARQALGLWAAGEAMDMAVARAEMFGIGMVSVRNATHFGCAGYHAARAVRHEMVGIVASNCGHQRIVRPPGGRVALLGTNPLSIAAPAGNHHPFVLDMATSVVPTGRIREAARAGRPVPEGWLEDDDGRPVTDPTAFDAGKANLAWLGGPVAAYKGFGLGLMVEVLSAVISGAGSGPSPDAVDGDGLPSADDHDIGFFVAAIAPNLIRHADQVRQSSQQLFGTILACPTTMPGTPVTYPGWHEAERSQQRKQHGVPISAALLHDLQAISQRLSLSAPRFMGALT